MWSHDRTEKSLYYWTSYQSNSRVSLATLILCLITSWEHVANNLLIEVEVEKINLCLIWISHCIYYLQLSDLKLNSYNTVITTSQVRSCQDKIRPTTPGFRWLEASRLSMGGERRPQTSPSSAVRGPSPRSLSTPTSSLPGNLRQLKGNVEHLWFSYTSQKKPPMIAILRLYIACITLLLFPKTLLFNSLLIYLNLKSIVTLTALPISN